MSNDTAPFTFREEDFDNLELVRQIVFHRLRNDDNWNQLDHTWARNRVSEYVEFEENRLRRRLVTLATEVMWQLITQGVITPGINPSNPNLPFFRITDYGERVLEEERLIPHDPTGYLDEVREAAGSALSDVADRYLEEGLRCFNAGCHVAAVLLLGVASEAVFLHLCDAIENNLSSSKERSNFQERRHIKGKHEWVTEKYENLPNRDKREKLPESLDLTLRSLYDLIRRQRNELGHPQDDPPDLSREEAFMFFRLFPGFLRHVEAFAGYAEAEEI